MTNDQLISLKCRTLDSTLRRVIDNELKLRRNSELKQYRKSTVKLIKDLQKQNEYGNW